MYQKQTVAQQLRSKKNGSLLLNPVQGIGYLDDCVCCIELFHCSFPLKSWLVMNQTQIIGALMLATGKALPAVAKEHGCTPMSFYRVMKGESVNNEVRAIIVSLTKKSEDELWPPIKDTDILLKKGKKNPSPLHNGSKTVERVGCSHFES